MVVIVLTIDTSMNHLVVTIDVPMVSVGLVHLLRLPSVPAINRQARSWERGNFPLFKRLPRWPEDAAGVQLRGRRYAAVQCDPRNGSTQIVTRVSCRFCHQSSCEQPILGKEPTAHDYT